MAASAAPVLPRLSDDELLHWLALRLIPGLGTRRAVTILERFRTPMAIFRASITELEAAGLSPGVARSIQSGCTFEDAATQHERLKATGAQIVPITSPLYPEKLRTILDPPTILYTRGDLSLLSSISIAVVGTRKPTPYGVAVAEKLSSDLATHGIAIISGMARGIDTAAHRGALQVNGKTIAVFGCGVDMVYPSENRKLYEEIAQSGLLLSEFPLGAPAFPQNFPIRNRIVSGMSSGVLIVEGAQYSGSAITARLAMDQGREVFSVPGNITSKLSWAPNLLIRQGAKLVMDAQDILSELAPDERYRLQTVEKEKKGDLGQQLLPLGPNAPLARAILDQLQIEKATHIDGLLNCLENYSSSETIAALFELELLGLVKQLPGKQYVKVW
jgi:DNA processing protein